MLEHADRSERRAVDEHARRAEVGHRGSEPPRHLESQHVGEAGRLVAQHERLDARAVGREDLARSDRRQPVLVAQVQPDRGDPPRARRDVFVAPVQPQSDRRGETRPAVLEDRDEGRPLPLAAAVVWMRQEAAAAVQRAPVGGHRDHQALARLGVVRGQLGPGLAAGKGLDAAGVRAQRPGAGGPARVAWRLSDQQSPGLEHVAQGVAAQDARRDRSPAQRGANRVERPRGLERQEQEREGGQQPGQHAPGQGPFTLHAHGRRTRRCAPRRSSRAACARAPARRRRRRR